LERLNSSLLVPQERNLINIKNKLIFDEDQFKTD
jgi:hypothetical protein